MIKVLTVFLLSFLLVNTTYGIDTDKDAGANPNTNNLNSDESKRDQSSGAAPDSGPGGGINYTGSGNHPGSTKGTRHDKNAMKKGRRAKAGSHQNPAPNVAPSQTPSSGY